MSTFDQASLVMIPSGYKTSKVYSIKPTDGSGDMSFSRSNDTATRVNSAGLIEKVRTNLVLQSQTFDNASWVKYNSSVTANSTTAPDGTSTADTLVDNTANDIHVTYQSIALSAGEHTISCYAKANTLSHLSIYIFDGTNFFSSGIFNLSNGTVSGAGSIVSAGNGWYRVSFTTTIGSGSGNVYIALSNGSTISYVGSGQSIYIWGYQVETGVATDYISTTSAAVSVGPVANVPRLYYLNSSCPRLLLEPQRTNLATYSEQFNNAAWTKSLCTISANASTSPDGYSNSDRITASAGTGIAQMYSAFSASAGAYTYSFFVKAGTHSQVFFGSYGTAAFGGAFTYRDMIFDIATGTITASAGNLSVSTQINNYGNGWYRVAVTYSATSNGTVTYILGLAKDTTTISGTWAGTENILGYGIQVEAGAYATSYIPTLGAAVTRGADACRKTGISSLIGQTEGTLFVEMQVNSSGESLGMWPRNGSAGLYGNFIFFGTNSNRQSRIQVVNGGAVQAEIIGSVLTAGWHKFAFAYKANDFAFYVDGVLVGTDSSGSVPSGMDELYIDQYIDGGIRNASKKQAMLFKTRLSNSELAALTTL